MSHIFPEIMSQAEIDAVEATSSNHPVAVAAVLALIAAVTLALMYLG